MLRIPALVQSVREFFAGFPFRPTTATFLTKVCKFLQLHNSPFDCARELFEPCMDSASVLVYFDKNAFWVWVSVEESQVGEFLHFLANFTRPWAPTQ